jgi:hypothetical protein
MIAGVHLGEQGLEPGRVAREQPGCGRALAFPYADRRSRRSDDLGRLRAHHADMMLCRMAHDLVPAHRHNPGRVGQRR